MRLPLPTSVLALSIAALAGLFLPGSAGAWLLYPTLGLIPGLALARFLPLERDPLARAALGLAVAPLVSAVLGWALIAAGLPPAAAARWVALASWIAWVLAAHGPDAGAPALGLPAAGPGERFARLFAVCGALLVAVPMFVNPYLRVRSDSWVHAALAYEILDRGIPPEEPRFAGLALNYVWFYNLFIALCSGLRGGDPFVFIVIFSAAGLAATLLLAWLAGRRLWGPGGAAGCALLVGLGFNAGAWLLWPLQLVRALVGRDRGWGEVLFELGTIHLGNSRVIWNLSAPFAYMASFLDKFLIGTAVSYAYLMLLLSLWALVAWIDGVGRRALAWAGAAACGMLLFHGVVGLSAIPVLLGTLAAASLARRRWNWLPGTGRLGAWGLATLAGALLAAPYMLAITRGWSPDRSGSAHSYFQLDLRMLWTLATACVVAAWFARGPLRGAFAERRPAPVVLAGFALGMAAFAAVVALPVMNHVKFVYQVFLPVALIGGPAVIPRFRALLERRGRATTLLLFSLVFAAPPAFTLAGYLADPGGRTAPELNPVPGEPALYDWIRRETPTDAVFLDHENRSVIPVLGRRQVLQGTKYGPEMAFPRRQVEERRAVMADLYGPLADLERDAAALRALGRPVYVLYRAADFAGRPFPALALAARPCPFRRVYDREGFVVYHLGPPAPAATGGHAP